MSPRTHLLFHAMAMLWGGVCLGCALAWLLLNKNLLGAPLRTPTEAWAMLLGGVGLMYWSGRRLARLATVKQPMSR